MNTKGFILVQNKYGPTYEDEALKYLGFLLSADEQGGYHPTLESAEADLESRKRMGQTHWRIMEFSVDFKELQG